MTKRSKTKLKAMIFGALALSSMALISLTPEASCLTTQACVCVSDEESNNEFTYIYYTPLTASVSYQQIYATTPSSYLFRYWSSNSDGDDTDSYLEVSTYIADTNTLTDYDNFDIIYTCTTDGTISSTDNAIPLLNGTHTGSRTQYLYFKVVGGSKVQTDDFTISYSAVEGNTYQIYSVRSANDYYEDRSSYVYGYDIGLTDGATNLENIIKAPTETATNFLYAMLNWDIAGVNVFGLLGTLLSVVVVVWLIRKFN